MKSDYCKNLKPSTLFSYKGYVENQLTPYFYETPLTEITEEKVNEFKHTMLNDGLSTSTVNKYIDRYGILHHPKTNGPAHVYNSTEDNLISSNEYKSIEAQLVAKVDTLTYLYHDLDDAIKNKNIFNDMRVNDKKTFEKFLKELNEILKTACDISNIPFEKIKYSLDNYSSNICFCSSVSSFFLFGISYPFLLINNKVKFLLSTFWGTVHLS